jgi:hypothetical protein
MEIKAPKKGEIFFTKDGRCAGTIKRVRKISKTTKTVVLEITTNQDEIFHLELLKIERNKPFYE